MKRNSGCRAAITVASATATSFFWRFTNGRTYCGVISFTSWPSASSAPSSSLCGFQHHNLGTNRCRLGRRQPLHLRSKHQHQAVGANGMVSVYRSNITRQILSGAKLHLDRLSVTILTPAGPVLSDIQSHDVASRLAQPGRRSVRFCRMGAKGPFIPLYGSDAVFASASFCASAAIVSAYAIISAKSSLVFLSNAAKLSPKSTPAAPKSG